MSKGNGWWGALTKALGEPGRATTRRWVYIWMVMVAIGLFWVVPQISAQDKKPEEAKPAAEMAPKPAEAPKAPEAAGPKADPNGSATGVGTFAADGAGTLFMS